MEITLNKINHRNKKIDENINTIINHNKNNCKLNENYEIKLKEVLEDDY